MRISANAILKSPTQQSLHINADKRIFVIGDLDADLAKFHYALKSVNFNKEKDVLISLGDVIDRGNDSLKLLNTFSTLGVHMVLGNHEHMMLESIIANDKKAHALWTKNGGNWHLNVDKQTLRTACEKLVSYPLSILLDYQGEKIGLSHTLGQQWDWSDLNSDKKKLVSELLWDREVVKQDKIFSNRGVLFSIHGHNATKKPFWIFNTYHIDTNYKAGRPTIVELSELINYFKATPLRELSYC
ncbi:MAG: metallophosphoesterase [Pseudoalteromonas sp.]|uniref:metallophosphoesterase n=1 Tax=Pseudoalteromonas TaxID=53246 RepID=UPI003F9916EF